MDIIFQVLPFSPLHRLMRRFFSSQTSSRPLACTVGRQDVRCPAKANYEQDFTTWRFNTFHVNNTVLVQLKVSGTPPKVVAAFLTGFVLL